MNTKPLTSSPKKNFGPLLHTLIVLVYVAINVFKIGGDAFVLQLNGNIGNPLALVVTILAILLWRRLRAGNQDRQLWLYMAIGWALWTVAEFWWGIANLLGEEVPYPSGADIFWLIGYLPIAVALITRIRRLPIGAKFWQEVAIGFCIVASVGWTIVAVLVPTIQNNDPTAVVVNVLNLLYPLLDLLLLVLVLNILFPYQHGLYGRAWFWISGGFVLHSISGLVFVYATTAGLYYPDGQANMLSTLAVDVPYNLGYAAWMVGLLIVLSINKRYRPLEETKIVLAQVPNTHCLIFTRGDDCIIDFSHNFGKVFPPETIHAKTIEAALGISGEIAAEILREIKTKKMLSERTLIVTTQLGQQRVGVSGIVVASQRDVYEGLILLVRLQHAGASPDEALTAYEKDLLSILLSQVGIQEDGEVKRLLANYYLAHIQPLYKQVYAEGGGVMADAFFTVMQAAALQQGWQIGLRPDSILQVDSLTLPQARRALPAVFEAAKHFVATTIDDETVNNVIQDVQAHIDEAISKDIEDYLNPSA